MGYVKYTPTIYFVFTEIIYAVIWHSAEIILFLSQSLQEHVRKNN